MHLREKSTRIKEHPSWEASINTKNIFFDSFTLVYIRLDSSSDSFALVYIRLVTRPRSTTFVYTRLGSSSDSSVFLEQTEVLFELWTQSQHDIYKKRRCWMDWKSYLCK